MKISVETEEKTGDKVILTEVSCGCGISKDRQHAKDIERPAIIHAQRLYRGYDPPD